MLKPEASAFSGPKIAPSKLPALRVRWAGGSQLFSTWDLTKSPSVGRGGSQPFSTWDPTSRLGFTMLIWVRGGPMITIFTAL